LAAEEALEVLLASLPAPRLPAGLAERLLRRLADARAGADELDLLLLHGEAPSGPADLAGRVLSALAPARREQRDERALDRLLAEVEAPATPPALAERVLAALAAERNAVDASRGPRRSARPRRRVTLGLLLAAASVLAVVAVRLGGERRPARVAVEPAQDELLAALDVLENWDLVTDDDVDLLLADLDAADELPDVGADAATTVGPWRVRADPLAHPTASETDEGDGG
jgi:hypothetical protein